MSDPRQDQLEAAERDSRHAAVVMAAATGGVVTEGGNLTEPWALALMELVNDEIRNGRAYRCEHLARNRLQPVMIGAWAPMAHLCRPCFADMLERLPLPARFRCDACGNVDPRDCQAVATVNGQFTIVAGYDTPCARRLGVEDPR